MLCSISPRSAITSALHAREPRSSDLTRAPHSEHHDFPSVPWTRLPALRRIAAEFYDPLPWHASWPMVTLRFIFDDSVGLFSRVKRPQRSEVALPAPMAIHEAGGKGAAGGVLD
jgi:sphingolipid delta-4 desaturase